MVEISKYGSGEGPGWETGPGYSTGAIEKDSFMGRKGDSSPGWRTLWTGFEKLLYTKRGFLVAGERFG
jgi:hypothetical protein